MTWKYYTLDERGNPRPEPDLITWGKWFDKADRKVAHTVIYPNIHVSTVFLGLGHGPDGTELWESMVFGGPLHNEMRRCAGSKEQAEAMHARMVAWVKDKLPLDRAI